MHLALGRKEAYSIEIVMRLAESPPGVRVKAREIGAAAHVSGHYVAQVLADLVRAGVLNARAGRGGGYELARPPSEITLLDVIEAAGGSVAEEAAPSGGAPSTGHGFALQREWSGVRSLLSAELRRTRITDLNAAVRTLAAAISSLSPGDPPR